MHAVYDLKIYIYHIKYTAFKNSITASIGSGNEIGINTADEIDFLFVHHHVFSGHLLGPSHSSASRGGGLVLSFCPSMSVSPISLLLVSSPRILKDTIRYMHFL